jgi:hypothetical protein
MFWIMIRGRFRKGVETSLFGPGLGGCGLVGMMGSFFTFWANFSMKPWKIWIGRHRTRADVTLRLSSANILNIQSLVEEL